MIRRLFLTSALVAIGAGVYLFFSAHRFNEPGPTVDSTAEGQAPSAWVVDLPDQTVAGARQGEVMRVAFRLRNTSSRSLRVVGAEAC